MSLVLRKAAAGHRCWETKVAKGTVLEPRWAGVADARGRRAASPQSGWVGGKSENEVVISV